jgi:hypothetical protein
LVLSIDLSKTFGDLNSDKIISAKNMHMIIAEYNESRHFSTKIAPNKFTHGKEVDWMNQKMNETHKKESVGLPEGSLVKILNEGSFMKRRMNYSKDAYKINSRDGNQYIVESQDKSVGRYPLYKLHSVDNGTLANSLKDDKYGIIDKILNYTPKTNKYWLEYEGGAKDNVLLKILRKGNLTRLSFGEVEYWNKHGEKGNLPEDMSKLV